MKKVTIALVIIASVLGTLAAAPTPARDSVTIALFEEPKSLDPLAYPVDATTNVMVDVRESLAKVDRDGNLVPLLAERWQVSPDGLVLTIHLRKGVSFSNGKPFNADAVLYSFDRVRKFPQIAVGFAKVKETRKVDDYTVALTFASPDAIFMYTVANPYVTIYEPSSMEAAGADAYKSAIGTGPYIVKEWQQGKYILKVVNEKYWGKQPAIKKATYRFITDADSALVALENGEVDFVYRYPANMKAAIRANKKLSTYEFMSSIINTVNFNTKKAPFDNPLVRQAVAHVVNKEEAIAVCFEGEAPPASSINAPTNLGYNPNAKAIPHDMAKAKALLAQAGYANGLTIKMPLASSYVQIYGYAEVLQDRLKEVGVNLVIDRMDSTAAWKAWNSGQYDIRVKGEANPFREGSFYVYSYATGMPYNSGFVSDKRIDDLYAKAAATFDSKKREQIYWDIEKIVLDNYYAVPICFQSFSVAKSADLQVAYISPSWVLELADLSWKK